MIKGASDFTHPVASTCGKMERFLTFLTGISLLVSSSCYYTYIYACKLTHKTTAIIVVRLLKCCFHHNLFTTVYTTEPRLLGINNICGWVGLVLLPANTCDQPSANYSSR